MKAEITDAVPGLTDAQVQGEVEEAERGYVLGELVSEPNPHRSDLPTVPVDLIAEIAARAARDGETPDDVVRRALLSYLHSA
ncbi:hypothetical protein NODU109028_12915 [Nocardioides dubius]|uniref:Ribbon-helix-helix protein, CopG family n=1 Tax=Nocardioides dubius TaxID=317019 RepID=A0ABP4EE18_9ACTN